MSLFALVLTTSVTAVPCDRHFDFSNWTGQFKASYTVVITARDGAKLDVVCDLAAGGSAAQACDSLWFLLTEAGWRGERIGKTEFVIRGSKNARVKSVEVVPMGYAPLTWAVPVLPKKK